MSHGEKDLDVEFVVENRTDESVYFADQTTSCGCTQAKLGQDRLGPGERTKLVLSANLSQYIKHVEKIISCDLITENGEIWRYSFRIDAYPESVVEPGELYLGELAAEKPVVRTVEYRSHAMSEGDLFEVESLLSSRENVLVERVGTATTNQLASGPFQYRCPLQITVLPEPGNGSQRAQISLRGRAEEEETEHSVPVVWVAMSHFSIEPGRVFFGRVSGAEQAPPVKEIEIARDDGEPFSITSATVPTEADSLLEVNVAGKSAQPSHRISVRLIPPQQARRALYTSVSIHTDDDAQPVLQIPVSAFFES